MGVEKTTIKIPGAEKFSDQEKGFNEDKQRKLV